MTNNLTSANSRIVRWASAFSAALAVIVLGLLGGVSPAASASASIPNFTTAVVSQLDYSHCLDVYHSGTADYTNVDIWGCNNTAAQSWTFVYLGKITMGNVYQIKAGVGSNMCLDDYHSSTADWNNVEIFKCNGSTAQVWVARGSELVSGVNPNDLMCLNVEAYGGPKDGENVDIHHCLGLTGQYWDF
jgi:Ricin-type beta-trefoil lectin domain